MDRDQLIGLGGIALLAALTLMALYADGRLVCLTAGVDTFTCQVFHATLRMVFPRVF